MGYAAAPCRPLNAEKALHKRVTDRRQWAIK